jgi:hypothetical protein
VRDCAAAGVAAAVWPFLDFPRTLIQETAQV